MYTNSWYDIAREKEAALRLINDGCVLISQFSDSTVASLVCEEQGVPNVSSTISTISVAPNTALVSSKINWQPYMELIIKKTMEGKGNEIPYDWCGGLEEGAVELTELNSRVAANGTQAAIDAAIEQFKTGTLKVFDTSNFTVNGQTLTEYLADVDGDYIGETNAVHDGYFDESASNQRSAPYFDIIIDGITRK